MSQFPFRNFHTGFIILTFPLMVHDGEANINLAVNGTEVGQILCAAATHSSAFFWSTLAMATASAADSTKPPDWLRLW